MSPALPLTFGFLDATPDFGEASQSDGFMPSISYEMILFYSSLSTFVLAGNLHLFNFAVFNPTTQYWRSTRS